MVGWRDMNQATYLVALVLSIFPCVQGQQSSCAATVASTGANCNCSLCTSSMGSLCCAFTGIPATLLAFEEDDLWIPRLEEFNGCTGAKVTLTYTPDGEDGMQAALEEDVGVHYTSGDGADFVRDGAGIFDSYIVQAPWMPAIEGGLEDLGPRILDGNVNWLDINSQSRQIVSFNGSVRALPLDVDYIAIGYREDVFQNHGIAAPPKTLEELVELSERLTGQDHNGDGVPDWGFCLTPQPNYFYAFVTPIMQRTIKECDGSAAAGGAPACTGELTGQNPFFDVQTFEPLLDNPGFRHAVDLHRRFLKASNCPDQIAAGESCHRKPAMQAGRCAGVISMPGTMTRMLKPWSQGGSWAPQPRYLNETHVEWEVQDAPDGTYWGRRAKFPGSSKVFADGQLRDCTPELCPKASELDSTGKLVNFAPFFAEGGEAYALRAGSPSRKKDLMFELFEWLASLPYNKVPLSGVYRNSHLTSESKQNLMDQGWPEQMATDLHEVLAFYFRDSEAQGGNSVQDLLVLGFSEYMGKFDQRIYKELLLRPDVLNGSIPDTAFEALYREALDSLLADYAAISEGYGLLSQLQRWRGSMGLSTLSKSELCTTFAAFSATNADALLRSGVDCSPASYGSNNDDGMEATLILIVIVLGGFLGAFIVFAAVFWLRRMIVTNRRLQAEAKALMDAKLEEACDSVKEIQAPMTLMKATDFKKLGRPVPHEKALADGMLVSLHAVGEKMEEFLAVNKILFFSHQWLGWECPDPTNVQYEAMVKAVDFMLAKAGIAVCSLYIWFDWFSIPQQNRFGQKAAINSLPVYASTCNFFVVVAPDSQHHDTGREANLQTYHSRCWCRAEVMSHWAKKGSENMYYATSRGLQPMAPDGMSQELLDALHVFDGELTCCSRRHPKNCPCDREALVAPMVGLYQQIYAAREEPEMQEVFDAIEPVLHRIYPPTFEYATEEGSIEKPLFGDLISALRTKTQKEEGCTSEAVQSWNVGAMSKTSSMAGAMSNTSSMTSMSKRSGKKSKQHQPHRPGAVAVARTASSTSAVIQCASSACKQEDAYVPRVTSL